MPKYENISASEAALMFGALSIENRLKLFLSIASCCLLEEAGGDAQQCYVVTSELSSTSRHRRYPII